MKKILKTGNFLMPENKKDPIVLFAFNQFEDDVSNITCSISENLIRVYYQSGNTLDIECDSSEIVDRIKMIGKFIIIEVDDNNGDVVALYEIEYQ